MSDHSEMISSREALFRKVFGSGFGGLAVLLYVWQGALSLPAWGWTLLIGLSIGVLNTGVNRE